VNPVETRLAALEARLAAVESRLANGGGSASGGSGNTVADDRTLDGQWGDTIVIKTDPKRWVDRGGDSFVGCRMSECPSDYLEELASLFDWQADQDEKKGKTYKNKKGEMVPTAPLKRSDAAKARGWAKRNKGRTANPQQPLPQSTTNGTGDSFNYGANASAADDSEIPF
jgi:hypothetical protein